MTENERIAHLRRIKPAILTIKDRAEYALCSEPESMYGSTRRKLEQLKAQVEAMTELTGREQVYTNAILTAVNQALRIGDYPYGDGDD